MRKTEYITKIFERLSGDYFIVFDDGDICFGFFLTANYHCQHFQGGQRLLSKSLCQKIEEKCPYWKKITSPDVKWLMITSERSLEDLLSNLYHAAQDRKGETFFTGKPISNIESPFSIVSRMKMTSSG